MIQHSKTTLNKNDERSLVKTFRSGILTSSYLNEQFKDSLAQYLGKNIILCSSGSVAFFQILRTLNLKEGDEILIPDYICDSVLNVINSLGLTPRLYDNAKNKWTADYKNIVDKITDKTKAILINHTFGILVKDINKIRALKIPVIEDCCHALTPDIKGAKISKYSIASFYSFNSTKLLSTGEGGAIGTNDRLFYERLKSITVDKGLSDLSCTLGISQLKRLPEFLEKRAEIALLYDKKFKDVPKVTDASIYFRYPLLVKNQNDFMTSKRVAFKKGVDNLLHKKLAQQNVTFPNTTNVYGQTVSIPIYPSLKKKELNLIIEEVQRWLEA